MNHLELINSYLKQAVLPSTIEEMPYGEILSGLYDPMVYMLDGGGKRLRPSLCILAYRLYGDDVERVLPAALGLEIYHNHTLLHDDVMDHADVRHGRPTVHKRWNESTAILSGDVMLILAVRHLLRTECEGKEKVMDVAMRTMQEICEGQQMDLNFETRRGDVDLDEYLEMIRLKTSVLPACALKVGALVGGASEKDAQLLYDFGVKIGLAFQIQDDYLDCYADEKVFGKAIGGDIRCGKQTFMLITAYRKATKVVAQRLDELLQEDEVDVKAVLNIYEDLKVGEEAQQVIAQLHQEANDILEKVSGKEDVKKALLYYTNKMLGRTK